ncbi:uncharacterized protein LOC122331153 isoform X2 [Puntigrus tetrazona]|uniref:uncharacterized protein LOC122331153 isoform X2 n=1 Tax=Puntigrus tetrazona TaxID=1606681 RepID=UPI001C8A8EEF|nr:uncharacterized protein LOC122331153 isoform X2 [Puntigrus tetrazona]
MKLSKTNSNLLFTLILVFHTMSVQAEVRILAVGVRGQSRFIAADLLSGRRDGGQEDGEIVKTPVITDEAGRTMLVTGPNLCEEDAERQTFTTALFLSTPGPHAVLMVLNLEDQQSGQCDVKKRAQEMLGAEVLQYCIVLLIQNHQEPFTGASGEMINACGGRFHFIRDSEPKPKALIAEINKLVWLNGHRFHSVLKQVLETEKHELVQRLQEIQNKLKGETNQNAKQKNPVFRIQYDTLAEVIGILVWIFFIVLSAVVIFTEGKHKLCSFGASLCALIIFMGILKNNLSPYVAVPINVFICSMCLFHALSYWI